MFSRYPGKGNSTPPVFTVTTSVPRPPVSPPPAVGGLFASGFAVVGRLGVASGLASRLGGLVLGTGMSRGAVFGRTGAGAAGVAVLAGFTAPAARSPAGAATRSTRYTGGAGAAGPGR